jgi:hypothetical protein
MERGCVEDQPQDVNTPEFRELLRLVEDDTAALRVFVTRSKGESLCFSQGNSCFLSIAER